MNISLYQAAAALSAYSDWQETIAQNLAASSVPGYRKTEISLSNVPAGNLSTSSINSPSVLTKLNSSLNMSPGEIIANGDKTSVAIDGKGFFEVRFADGSRGYTRDGEFKLDSQGQLMTKEGYVVQGESGPIQLDLNNSASLSISNSGEISQGPDVKGKLKLVDFNDYRLLIPISGGYFMADHPSLESRNVENVSVRQGCLERGNTSPTTEMAQLIYVMRAFDANQRVIQINDERMSRAINVLGNNV